MSEHEAQVRAATTPLARWVGTIATRLEERFVCEVREATSEELQRPVRVDSPVTGPRTSFAVQPRSPEAATLVVLVHELFTGTAVTLTFGEVGSEVVPCCDECAVLPPSSSDLGLDDLVQQAESAVWTATRGFAEFRWKVEDPRESHLGLEEGWFSSAGGASWSPAAPGPSFQRIWRPWQRREDPLPRLIG